MKKGISIICIMICFMANQIFAQKYNYLQGYKKSIKGEILHYESTQPDANSALLVRSLNAKDFIEWETEPVPGDFNLDTATFVWIAGIDVNKEESHQFKLLVNDQPGFSFKNPTSADKKYFSWEGNSMRLEYKGVKLDRHSDYMGYMFLHVPVSLLNKGKALRLKVVGESAGSRSWYMIFRYGCRNFVDLFTENAVLKTAEGPRQQLRFSVVYLGAPAESIIQIGDVINRKVLNTGLTTIRLAVPIVDKPTKQKVSVNTHGQILFDEEFTIGPTKAYQIHLIHHSHVDIGYTHVQEEVEQMQWKFIDDALEVDLRNSTYPPEAQTKWNVEVMWAVNSYLKNASEEKKKAFINAVQHGTIELDALYGNQLLALCSEDELYRLTEHARSTARLCGVELNSAMITDVPGWTWSIVPVLAKSGVRYFSMGTNRSHRIGDIIEEWGDRPFYWISACSKEKVLCWIHSEGYSLFHGGLNVTNVNYDHYETLILEYTNMLNRNRYEYDIVPLRYNIGSDNGPLDLTLSDFVTNWNERYISPKLIISTVSETFREFERKYGDIIPGVKGDITAYWEDGAVSSAKETALNRANAERLSQAQTLWALTNPMEFPVEKFTETWEKVMLYDEHTWGAYNSISEPEDDFVKHQWNVKRNFAISADKLSNELIKAPVNSQLVPENPGTVTLYNTNSWDITDLVLLPADPTFEKSVFTDDQMNQIPAQFLADGRVALKVNEIPALGSKSYNIRKGNYRTWTQLRVDKNTLENEFLKVIVDQEQGVITSIIDKKTGNNLVNRGYEFGMNQYLYVAGRSPDNPLKNTDITVRVGEKGSLISSLIVESNAPGCNRLHTEIILEDGKKQLEIVNHLDKKLIYEPEGVHFAFPFNIPDGITRIDMPFGYYEPDKDQLPGSNKNFFTIRRWVDISNENIGISLISPDAPLIELNDITTDPITYGWVDEVNPNGVIYSYVMNNYWETNYLAGQEGEVVFRYFIIPHAEFRAEEVEKNARRICQPLITTFSENTGKLQTLFHIKNSEILLGSIKPFGDKIFLVRFDNVVDKPKMLNLHWYVNPGHLFESNPDGDEIQTLSNYIFNPFESRFILVKL